MYNIEQKERYIAEEGHRYSESYIKCLRSTFNKVGEMEGLLQKDACNFSHEDIASMYSLYQHGDAYIYSAINSRLLAYTEWCILQFLVSDGCNHYKEFSFNDYNRYINKRIEANKYISREELMHFVLKVNNPRDQFVLMCLFEFGKSERYEDITRLKLEDIDKRNNICHLPSGRTVNISDEFIYYAELASKEWQYFTKNKKRLLVDSKYIFKRVSGRSSPNGDGTILDNKLFTRLIKNLVEDCDMNLGINAASIAVSGQIDMIQRRAAELDIEKTEYVNEYFGELRQQYQMSPDDPRKFLNKYGAYL